MIEYYINNNLTDCVKDSHRFQDLSDNDHIRLYNEIKNATLQGIDNILVQEVSTNVKRKNNVQSLLLWVLNITDEKPIEDQIIKSPGSYMDVDSDFEKRYRENVIEYIRNKYTQNRFCQIATFGKMAAKGSIRNATRALGHPVSIGELITKYIPNLPDVTIQDSIDSNVELEELIKNDSDVSKIIYVAKKLEGLTNSVGSHASGVIITDTNTTDYFPLMSASRKDSDCIISQYEYKDVEDNFCLKFDILGLQTLDIIHETVDIIKKTTGDIIDINNIDVEDRSIYKLLMDGFTSFVFQFDGTAGAYIPKIKPDNVNEISDLTSILRPGPMSMGMVDQYVNAKFHNKKFNYNLTDQKLLDKVWDICSSSYGLLIYQESVIKCFTDISGFNEIDGDNSRRIVGKKKPDEMAGLLSKFVDGGIKNGYDKENLEELFRQIEGFANYGFNKSHAISYSYNTCYCAWLSANYPLQFYTAIMTICSDNTDDVRKAILACKKRNVSVLPPSINKSKTGFEIVDNSIVFGLSAIKGVGKALSNNIIKNRPKNGYISLGHFIVRNISILNKKVIEAYTKAGVFSEFGYSKNTILSSIDNILEFMSEFKGCKNNLLDVLSIDVGYFIEACLINYSDKPDSVYYECDAIGMYITKHPMEDYLIDNKALMSIDRIKSYDEDVEEFRVKTVGVVSGIEIRKTKQKANMCTFLYTDKHSSIPVTIFPSVYNKHIDEIEEGKIVYIDGFVKYDNGNRTIYPRSISLHNPNSIGLMRKLSSNIVIPKKTEEELIVHKIGKLRFNLEKING